MRLWSFHPKYLDKTGLSRAINEAISGYKALTGQQKMWQNHPQLERFKCQSDGKYKLGYFFVRLLNTYIWRKQIVFGTTTLFSLDFDTWEYYEAMVVTDKQLKYEWQHYLNKLKTQKGRDKQFYEELKDIEQPEPHPLFKVVCGEIESWEKI